MSLKTLIKVNDASFEERKNKMFDENTLVEFTHEETEKLGAIPDETPLVEEDLETEEQSGENNV